VIQRNDDRRVKLIRRKENEKLKLKLKLKGKLKLKEGILIFSKPVKIGMLPF
jgi:hypothetical protein